MKVDLYSEIGDFRVTTLIKTYILKGAISASIEIQLLESLSAPVEKWRLATEADGLEFDEFVKRARKLVKKVVRLARSLNEERVRLKAYSEARVERITRPLVVADTRSK